MPHAQRNGVDIWVIDIDGVAAWGAVVVCAGCAVVEPLASGIGEVAAVDVTEAPDDLSVAEVVDRDGS